MNLTQFANEEWYSEIFNQITVLLHNKYKSIWNKKFRRKYYNLISIILDPFLGSLNASCSDLSNSAVRSGHGVRLIEVDINLKGGKNFFKTRIQASRLGPRNKLRTTWLDEIRT